MKQSTKLLSLLLALMMAFSCMTVIGNAALVQSEVTYDSIDDAILSPEQVADMALDLVDNDLLAGMDTVDLSIIGELRLNKIDYIFQDVVNLRGGFVWSIGSGLLGDLKDLDFGPLNKGGNSWGALGIGGDKRPYQRADGDLVLIGQLLALIGNDNNSNLLSNAAYGIGTSDGIDLGLIGSFLDLGEIGDMLGDIPSMLVGLVYDMLIYGSYNTGYKNESYPSLDDLKDQGKGLPAEVDTLDEMADVAILNLLTNPQDYDWEGEGDAAVKIWDTSAVLLPSLKKVKDDYMAGGATLAQAAAFVSPLSNSLFGLIDFLAQYALDDLGIPALNNNLKKALMEAVEIDINEVKKADVDAKALAVFDKEEDYVTYIGYDCMAKGADGEWYYTTIENVTETDANGNPVLDDEGNEVSTRQRLYYKTNMASANEFAALINWDWKFVDSATTPKDGEIQLLYNNIIKDYDGDGTKSIVEGINDLIGLVYEAALTPAVKADFTNFVGNGTGFVKGANSNFMTNVNNIAKYILVNFGELVFGSTSPYAHLKKDQIINLDTIDLVAMIGPGFFEDVMPQLIFPRNADGTYAFHDGVQIYEFGALVIREFISDITPNVNYDEYIFADGVGSANGRQFATHSVNEWFNIILNMGVDIGYTYLYNITNFGDIISFNAAGTGFENAAWRMTNSAGNGPAADFPAFPAVTSTNVITGSRWQGMLDEVIIWGTRYVGSVTGTSVLKGFDVNTISGISGPLNKLSYILNSILPLGIANGFTSANYDFDVELFLNNGLKKLFETFDLSLVLGLLGRNTKSKYNMFDDTTVANAVLDLVNDILSLVFRNNILQGVGAASLNKQSLDTVISKASLKTTVKTLLNSLYNNHKAILYNALPVVGKLIKGWGTEQAFETPAISLDRAITLNNGATTEAQTVTVRNASAGVWRHYKDQAGNGGTDNQFKIRPVSVAAYNLDGTKSSYVTTSGLTTADINYGAAGSFQYSVANVPATGAIARFDYGYKVLDEDGKEMADSKVFYVSSYIWLNHSGTNEGGKVNAVDQNKTQMGVLTPQYINMNSITSELENSNLAFIVHNDGRRLFKHKVTGAATAGLTPGTANADDYLGSGTERKFDIPLFKNGQITCYGDESDKTMTISGASVNEATWEAQGFKSGDTTNLTLSFSATRGNLINQESSTKYSGTGTVVLRYYDGVAMSRLAGLAGDEMASPRLRDQYNRTGTSYADALLTSVDKTDKEGELILRDSNYSDTAWIDADKNVYAESQVADIVVTTDDDGNVTAKTGKVTVGGKEVAVKLVTKIDNATAWAKYEETLVAGARGGYQEFNNNSVYDFEGLYNALRVAANDVQYLKKTTEQLMAEGNIDDIDGDIDNLKALLNRVEAATTDNRDYTDYQMYRLNRLNDARDDAWYYINLKNDASNANVAEIDESFPYTWIEEDDLRKLVAGNATLSAYVGGTDNDGRGANLVLALLEKLSDEEIENKAEWLKNKKVEYASTTLLDINMATNYLDRVDDRLLYRFVDEDLNQNVITTYLDGELDSIDNMMGDVYDEAVASQYTARSWAKFIAAYDNACLVYEDTEELPLTQKNVFDAKWELQCCRNELVLVKDEADYSELEALIAQAEYALANEDLYDNTAKELGQVLAELGIKEEIVNADGDVIDLFPGSAYYFNAEPYDKDEQDTIDDVAAELKEALARLKFKGLEIKDDKGNANTATGIIVADNKDTADVNEEVTATIATIAAEMNADAVKKLFKVTATSANVGETNINVSNDLHYSLDTDLTGFAGTNSVVTFYTIYEGVKIPVATVRIVVEADINGDGAVDVLDATYESIVASGKAELEGCYFLAGNLVGAERDIDGNDYAEVVNRVKATA